MDTERIATETPHAENSELRERLEKERPVVKDMTGNRGDEFGPVLDAMLDPVALYKADGTPARVNAAMVKLLGHDPTGLSLQAYTDLLRSRGIRWLDCAPPPAGEPPCPCRRVLKGEASCSQKTFQINAADGHTLTIEANATLIQAEGGTTAVVAVWRDVTERRQAEDALSRSEERYHSLFNEMTEGFALHEIICDNVGTPCDYRFLDVNPAFEWMTGLKWEDVVGKTQTHLLPGDDPGLIKIYGEVALTGQSIHFDNYSSTLKRYYEIFAYCPVPRQFAVLFTDITERKKKEDELRKLNRRLKALGASSQTRMCAVDESEYLDAVCGIIMEDCGHAMVWIGYVEEYESKTVRAVAHAGFEGGFPGTSSITWADTERGCSPLGAAIRMKRPQTCREMLLDPIFASLRSEALKQRCASLIVLPLVAQGKVFGAICIYSREAEAFTADEEALLAELADDLAYGVMAFKLRNAQTQVEEALKNSEERYRSLVEFSPVALFVSRGERIDFVNPAALHLFGAAAVGQLVGKSPFELFHPDYHPIIRQRVNTLREGQPVPRVEGRIVRLDGETRDVEVAATPFRDAEELAIQVILRDITEQKIAEQKIVASLKEKETLLRELSHRTKNNMNVISNLITLQASSLKDGKTAEMLKDLQGRILTMSLVHEKLYQSNDLAAVDISEYVVGLTDAIMASYTFEEKAVTLEREIESIPFSIDDAIPCGLIINELMTNSLKYAFTERSDGKIRISLHRAGKEEVTLHYTDNGVGIPEGFDMKTAKSLGIKLVYLLATKQMKGSVELIHGNGAGFLLRLKTSATQMA